MYVMPSLVAFLGLVMQERLIFFFMAVWLSRLSLIAARFYNNRPGQICSLSESCWKIINYRLGATRDNGSRLACVIRYVFTLIRYYCPERHFFRWPRLHHRAKICQLSMHGSKPRGPKRSSSSQMLACEYAVHNSRSMNSDRRERLIFS